MSPADFGRTIREYVPDPASGRLVYVTGLQGSA
jgi:hypothetical protein